MSGLREIAHINRPVARGGSGGSNEPPPQGEKVQLCGGKGPGHSIRRLGDSWAARPIQSWSFPHSCLVLVMIK